ncbi:hypothetical protein ACQEUU_37545 [Nonomuraea sp. CA-218870]|uniref:hypothetical protein n=1 Tax=Nonomuraea sp. CA-218870 TaxID=3239998 RepID=UPI003D90CD34
MIPFHGPLPKPEDYGLTPEQFAPLLEQVLDECAEIAVDGIMAGLDRDPRFSPRIALALARRLQRRYGGT